MTIAELKRAIESYQRVEKMNEQKQAVFNYKLADLFAHSLSRMFSASSELPSISDVYPTLFDGSAEEEQKKQKQEELSFIRFKQFANSFNNRLKKGVAK